MGSTEKTFGITYNKKLIWPPCLFLVVMLIKGNIAKVTASGKYPSIYTIYDTSKYVLYNRQMIITKSNSIIFFSCGFRRPGNIALFLGNDVKNHLISLTLNPSGRRIEGYGEVSYIYC